jgi:hypothetical protein
MCALNQMLFCSGFSDAKWALPVDTPVGVRRCLIGWRMSSSPLDGGAPPEVARIFVSSLVRHARVTFAEGIPRPFGLFNWSIVHTRGAREAERLFDAAYISWSMGSQVAFLSTPTAPPPPISKTHYNTRLDSTQLLRLHELGGSGIFAAGVDGDVAGLYTFDDGLLNGILSSLKNASEEAGARWREVDEDEFAELVAY